jgi:hypothetical protein
MAMIYYRKPMMLSSYNTLLTAPSPYQGGLLRTYGV